ncbi:hypothetical protein TRFO_39952 [Tritrichomonas foetus]|uniref:Nucleotide-diphospho-sugar transferase domain-containing protein n=1 Tax=Tritrichomonas foetus TaxID=1144522 RepID=A0A1J4J9J2_9EUKA|nr:hypothetical protein TRFO_39952 [Tritrichomonas foetus]|eukprot:OHS93908.1 hypothetical protein TRFO_39952 [Tritrichomonas foetus]
MSLIAPLKKIIILSRFFLATALIFCVTPFTLKHLKHKTTTILFSAVEKKFIPDQNVFVSCYFPVTVGPMRHPLYVYFQRVQLLLNTFMGELFLFTTNEGKEIIGLNSNFSEHPNIHVITKYQTVKELPKIRKNWPKYLRIEKEMLQSETYNVSAEIGAIWNSKLLFLEMILKKTKAKYIHWIDIGIMKNDEMGNLTWPSTRRLAKLFEHNENRVLFSLSGYVDFNYISDLDETYIKNYEFVVASYFGGTLKAMNDFLETYWKLHDKFLQEQFVLREEYIISTFCVYFPEKCIFIKTYESNCYMWHSAVSFISYFNTCNHSNALYTIIKTVNKEFHAFSLHLQKHDLVEWD